MKKVTTITIIALCLILFTQDVQNQNQPRQKAIAAAAFNATPGGAAYFQGVITLKLKEGLGDFSGQTGMVSLGITSLDEKLQRFGVYELDKRFRFNPEKSKQYKTDLSRIYKIRFPGDTPFQQVVMAFLQDPNVEYAEPIPIHRLDVMPDDEMYEICQHLPQIMAEEAWDIHKGEDGAEEVIVAIVDTGVEWDHEDLQSNIWQNMGEDADGDGVTMEYIDDAWQLDPDDINGMDDDGNGFEDDLIGWDFAENGPDIKADPGNSAAFHGTHCAGIAAGATNNGIGIASISWNISLMGICADQNNTLAYGYDGIIYAAENGADIISTSWSSGGNSQANQEVIDYVNELGCIFLSSAGNHNATTPLYPSSFIGAISVASVNAYDGKAVYSGFGPAIDISAPGGGLGGAIMSTVLYNSYSTASGTSMACPLAAGCLGLLKSYHPQWTKDELIMHLMATADNIDTLNPGYEYMLGSGRVNAFTMLDEETAILPQELKIDLVGTAYDDSNGNMINEPGEEVSLSAEFRNWMAFVGDEDATATLSTEDPDITILDGTATVHIPADSYFTIEDQFKFQVSEEAESHMAEFTIAFESDLEVVLGQEHTVEVLVAPSGVFIYEGTQNQTDFSGTFIKDVLDQLGIHQTYSNTYPPTLLGFETAFLSHGNPGEFLADGAPFTEDISLMLQEFMEAGGNLFIDMGTLFGALTYYGYPNAADLRALMGVQSNYINFTQNPINLLYGETGSIMEGMEFNESTQVYNWYIDDLTITDDAVATFLEQDYGIVSVMYDGEATYGHKSFYLGYTLAALKDATPQNSRNSVLLKVLDFFGMLDAGYMLPGFAVDNQAGGTPLEVDFLDMSLSDPEYPIQSWQWDFDEDGIIDSQEQNPGWTFTNPGDHSVTLIISNAMGSDTLTKEDCIRVNHGYLVFEGKEDWEGYSGTYIRSYMEQNGFYGVTYTNEFPPDLRGYWAVFLSFGNFDSENTILTDEMAEIIMEYIEDGGFVYLEGGDSFGWDQPQNTPLLNAFGVDAALDGDENPIDNLAGQAGTLTEGQVFTSTSQQALTFIDVYTPMQDAHTAFIESDYGTVAVQYTGESQQRTFCFSYTLADLDDGESPSTREDLLNRICGFFDITTGIGDVVQSSRFKVQGYPNPTSGEYSIAFTLDQLQPVSLQVFDIRGVMVDELTEQVLPAGKQELVWDASHLEEGIYFCRVQVGNESLTMKIIKTR